MKTKTVLRFGTALCSLAMVMPSYTGQIYADDNVVQPGAHVTKDEDSVTGYTVHFAYDATNEEKEVSKVEVLGSFN